MHTDIQQRLDSWLNSDFLSDQDRKSLEDLAKNDPKEIEEAFYKELEFGTGGIRSIIGLGTNRINIYNIRKATQAFANAINDAFEDPKMVICYDSRLNSDVFAKEAAAVLAANNIEVVMFDHLAPTPMLSFAVRWNQAQGGIMITASHNPRIYNGYKAYWSDGCQVTSPYDKKIISAYESIKSFSEVKTTNYETAYSAGKIKSLDAKCEEDYYQTILDNCFNLELCKKHGPEFGIVYSPLHGTGGESLPRTFSAMGFTNVHYVQEQLKPDASFPTVNPPNPEEKEALELSIKLMHEKKADIAMATDPDTDRVGLVVRDGDTEHILTGNQIGLLLLHYVCSMRKNNNSLGDNPLFIKTIVTSDLQRVVAESFGVASENTLTGFKWICGKLKEYEDQGKPFDLVFATEESFGYLSHDKARDKDAVNSCALVAEMSLYYKQQGKSLLDALDDIYTEYGFAHESLVAINYLGKEGAEKIARIMDHFREMSGTGEFAGQTIEIIEDYKSSKTKNLLLKTEKNIDLPASNVIGLHFKDGDKLYLRPSGTEPKIKFYIMVQENVGGLDEKKKKAMQKISHLEDIIKQTCDKI